MLNALNREDEDFILETFENYVQIYIFDFFFIKKILSSWKERKTDQRLRNRILSLHVESSIKSNQNLSVEIFSQDEIIEVLNQFFDEDQLEKYCEIRLREMVKLVVKNLRSIKDVNSDEEKVQKKRKILLSELKILSSISSGHVQEKLEYIYQVLKEG